MKKIGFKFQVANIKKALNNSLKKKANEREELFFEEVIKVVKLLNKDLEKNGHNHLDLSDRRLLEEFGIEPRKAKRIRQKLQSIGAIKIYEVEVAPGVYKKQLQTGRGTYPSWVPNNDKNLKLVKAIEIKNNKKKSTPIEDRMVPAYCVKYHKVVAEWRELGLFDNAPIGYAMALINIEMNEWMEDQGLTRDDFRL